MNEIKAPKEEYDEAGFYEIRLRGHLADRWTAWFEGLAITRQDNGNTRLSGPVSDQSALHGLLRKVRDLGMPLLSVNRLEPDRTLSPELKPVKSQAKKRGCH